MCTWIRPLASTLLEFCPVGFAATSTIGIEILWVSLVGRKNTSMYT